MEVGWGSLSIATRVWAAVYDRFSGWCERCVGLGSSEQVAFTPEERSALVSQSAGDPRCRCLVAVGGDGTVAALLNEQPSVPLTVLPAGTENLVAQHFGLGRDPEALADTIASGQPVRVDVGLVGGSPVPADGRIWL